MSDTFNHQAYQDFPQLDYPLVDEDGRLNYGWYRLLVRMWQACGLSNTGWQKTSFLQATPIGTTPVTVYGLQPDGTFGPIGPVPIPGSAAADQIAFEALRSLVPQDDVRQIIETSTDSPAVLRYEVPQEFREASPFVSMMLATPGVN